MSPPALVWTLPRACTFAAFEEALTRDPANKTVIASKKIDRRIYFASIASKRAFESFGEFESSYQCFAGK